MVSAVGKCPMGCLIGGLIALGCGGDALTLGTLDKPESAAVSGRTGALPSAESLASGAAAPTPAAGAGTDYVGEAGGVGAELAVAGAGGAAGEAGSSGMAGGAGSGRWRRRGGSAGAAEGGGGSSGMRGSGQATTRAGTEGSRAGDSGGAAAQGCVQNLACQLPAPPSTGSAHQDCVDRINQFRQECACLPPLERWVEGEACADEMARYDSAGSEAHAAFGDGICDGGSAQNECPGWRSEAQVVGVCLQRMWDEGPPPMSDCSGSCFQMFGHFLNMTNQRLSKVACGFYKRDDGQIWSVQNFTR